MHHSIGAWVGFNVFVLIMLALDLGVFHRKDHVIRFKEAIGWTAIWVALALVFNAGVYFWLGPRPGLEFLTGYLIEKSLSIDNIFVFVLVFGYFRVPAAWQHKVLFWGILGALVMRAIFIFAGVALIEKFTWSLYIFGVLLILTGIKLFFEKNKEIHPERNPVIRLARRIIPVTHEYEGSHFFVRHQPSGRRMATPLFLVLLFVETTDLLFAIDSIPAILAVTTDPYIVYTSNVFAILGLRSLYFALAGVMQLFYYLHYGLAVILIFVGVKMLLAHTAYKIPIGLSLGVIAGVLAVSVILSLALARKEAPAAPQG